MHVAFVAFNQTNQVLVWINSEIRYSTGSFWKLAFLSGESGEEKTWVPLLGIHEMSCKYSLFCPK